MSGAGAEQLIDVAFQLLWSRPLPDGTEFTLDTTTPQSYLHHASAVGEFFLGSDSIVHSYRGAYRNRLDAVMEQVPPEHVAQVHDEGSTMGGYVLFPGDVRDRKPTINGARGMHPRITSAPGARHRPPARRSCTRSSSQSGPGPGGRSVDCDSTCASNGTRTARSRSANVVRYRSGPDKSAAAMAQRSHWSWRASTTTSRDLHPVAARCATRGARGQSRWLNQQTQRASGEACATRGGVGAPGARAAGQPVRQMVGDPGSALPDGSRAMVRLGWAGGHGVGWLGRGLRAG